jgi:hypothetical protein
MKCVTAKQSREGTSANCGHQRIPDKHEDAELTQLITSSAGFLLQAPEGPNRASHAPQLRYLQKRRQVRAASRAVDSRARLVPAFCIVCMYVDFLHIGRILRDIDTQLPGT